MQPKVAHYRQLADLLRVRIFSGHYDATGKLESEPALQREFGVTRPVVGRAVAILAAEGLVRTEHGRGSFVERLAAWRVVVSAPGAAADHAANVRLTAAYDHPAVTDLMYAPDADGQVWAMIVRAADAGRAAVAALATATAGGLAAAERPSIDVSPVS